MNDKKVTVKPVMNRSGCLWALLFNALFWLAIVAILWGIL